LLFSITLLFYAFFWGGISREFGWVFPFILKFVFLFGPLAFLYLKSVQGKTLHKKEFYHFLPFVLMALVGVPLQMYRVLPGPVVPALECTSLLLYSFLIGKEFRIFQKPKSDIEKFLVQFKIAFFGFTLSYISYYVLAFTGILRREYDYAISIFMALIIYLVGYRGYFLPEISSGQNQTVEKYGKSGLSNSAEKHYAEKLLELMHQKKFYLDSNLKIGTVADQLNVSVHHVSQIINSHFKQSFADFVNGFRVKMATELMSQPEFNDETLIGIAYACGFNNKVSFNNAFRKVTGMRPGLHRKLRRQDNLSSDIKYPQIEV
jgi:AraC-like DNA-binding protein